MRRNYWNVGRFLLLTLLASGLLACAGSDSPGGAGGGGAGGTTTTAGSGGSGGGAGGTSATTTALTGTDGTLCPLPTQLITDFTYAGSGDTTQVHFGDATTLAGGEYVYPTTEAYPVTSDVTGNNWHLTGTVGTYSGFGLFFDNCSRIDAPAYAGISFKVSGTVEQEGSITLGVDTLNDTITAAWLNAHGGSAKDTDPGRCVPPDSAANQWAQSTCAAPQQVIPVTDTPTVQNILWTDFTGGKPETDVKPTDIVGIHWFFPNPPGAGTDSPTTYKVDITLDDLSFIPK